MKNPRLSRPELLPSVQICPGCGKSVCTVAGRAAHPFLCGPSGVNSELVASPSGNDGRGVSTSAKLDLLIIRSDLFSHFERNSRVCFCFRCANHRQTLRFFNSSIPDFSQLVLL